MKRIWILCGGMLVLAGCGQKGPLYMPDKNASVVTRSGGGASSTSHSSSSSSAPR